MRIGAHRFETEGDTLVCHLKGDLTLAETLAATELIVGLEAAHGYYLALIDISELGTITPEARRHAGEWGRVHRSKATAFVGGSVLTRTVMTMLLRAISVLTGQSSQPAFCSSEEQARQWLAERRRALLKGA